MTKQTKKRSMTTDHETSKTSANPKKKKPVKKAKRPSARKNQSYHRCCPEKVESIERRTGTEGRYRCGPLSLGLVPPKRTKQRSSRLFNYTGGCNVYECGPWCGCDRARCQNRLVQRGIRVRLQVFQTEGRGWGVRCRDDLDRGTFVCIYAGVILQRVQSPTERPPPKLTRADLPSDDEVEVVTEWLAPPVLEGRSNLLEPATATSPPLHVPVIQRSADTNATSTSPQDRDRTVLMGGPEPPSPPAGGSGDQSPAQEKKVAMTTASPEEAAAVAAAHSVNGTGTETKSLKSLKRAMKVEDVNFLDASKEGNVSRFINHSCQPNLFIQNVFTDSHDPGFPVIAFFTSRAVKAGTELTWNYSADTQRKQEVPCLCGSNGCQGQFTIEETLCDMCEVEGETL